VNVGDELENLKDQGCSKADSDKYVDAAVVPSACMLLEQRGEVCETRVVGIRNHRRQ